MADSKVKAKDSASAGREAALLRATLENMAQGVAMYDGDHKLVTWNELFRQYLEMPDEFLGTDRTFSDYIRYIGARGEFGENADIEAGAAEAPGDARPFAFVRARAARRHGAGSAARSGAGRRLHRHLHRHHRA